MKAVSFILLSLLLVTGCSTMTIEEKNTRRAELDEMANKAITGLLEQDPGLKTKMDESLGYAVANMKLTKIPIVGAGGASVTVTARVIRIKVNSELTEGQ